MSPHPCPQGGVSQGPRGSPVSPSCPAGSNAPPAAASRTSTSTPSSATSTPASPAAPRAAMGTVAPGHPAAPTRPGEPPRPPVRTRGPRPPSHPLHHPTRWARTWGVSLMGMEPAGSPGVPLPPAATYPRAVPSPLALRPPRPPPPAPAQPPSRLPRLNPSHSRKALRNSRLVSQKDDVHVCIMCLRAIMNYQVGEGSVLGDPSGAPQKVSSPCGAIFGVRVFGVGPVLQCLALRCPHSTSHLVGTWHGDFPRSQSIPGVRTGGLTTPLMLFFPPSLASAW